MLHRVREGSGPRLVLVHGFTQTLASWDGIAPAWARRHEVVRVDLPGHGRSGHPALAFDDAAAALGEAGGRATYIGYSMGGRIALRLALRRPDLVDALVLIGASPGIEDAAEREQRRVDDERLAADIERGGVDAFLERWLSLPLFATLPRERAGVEARRENTAAGLADALRSAGTGTQAPLWGRLHRLAMPVLLLAGSLDEKYSAVTAAMAERIGANANTALIEGAGHAAHLERPDVVTRLVERFVADHAATP